jgi:hypothetical protein
MGYQINCMDVHLSSKRTSIDYTILQIQQSALPAPSAAIETNLTGETP